MIVRVEDNVVNNKLIVVVQGEKTDNATTVAKAYKEAWKELRKEDKE